MLVKVFYLWKFLRFFIKKNFFYFFIKRWIQMGDFILNKKIYIWPNNPLCCMGDGCPMANVPDDALIN